MTGGGSFRTFFEFGIEHILTGYDHLLFLVGLWLVASQMRRLVWIVSSFTVAHTITLAAATLDVVRLPELWVEPLIAATIAFVGIENLVMRGREPPWRVALTFAFGLLHGFGFSNVLREALNTSAGTGIALPLLAFNLGVETGQLAATAIGLPVIWWLRKRPATKERVVFLGSAVVAACGVLWVLIKAVDLLP